MLSVDKSPGGWTPPANDRTFLSVKWVLLAALTLLEAFCACRLWEFALSRNAAIAALWPLGLGVFLGALVLPWLIRLQELRLYVFQRNYSSLPKAKISSYLFSLVFPATVFGAAHFGVDQCRSLSSCLPAVSIVLAGCLAISYLLCLARDEQEDSRNSAQAEAPKKIWRPFPPPKGLVDWRGVVFLAAFATLLCSAVQLVSLHGSGASLCSFRATTHFAILAASTAAIGWVEFYVEKVQLYLYAVTR